MHFQITQLNNILISYLNIIQAIKSDVCVTYGGEKRVQSFSGETTKKRPPGMPGRRRENNRWISKLQRLRV